MATPLNMILLTVDTASIQQYIFNSNRLRENIGASYLVAAATKQWALDAVLNLGVRHNIDAKGNLSSQRSIDAENDTLDVEIIYAGGGNFTALFRSPEHTRSFTEHLSRRVLCEAPGLRLSIHRTDFDFAHDALSTLLTNHLREMKRIRSRQSNIMPLAGLGVTVMCRSTALPAVGLTPKVGEEVGRPASAEILAKIAAAFPKGVRHSSADKVLREQLPPGTLDAGILCEYPADFDDLGRSHGESSLIAVVHADGDGIGSRIEALRDVYPATSQNRAYIMALQSFFEALNRAALNALNQTLDKLKQSIRQDEGEWVIENKNAGGRARITLQMKNGELILPFRPIVFGGDDVTFVCDGRLGIALALDYVQRFAETTEKEQALGKLSACVGIAIVASHYPFSRSYHLAEALCHSAKIHRRKTGYSGACLDWHFTTGGIYGEIDHIRKREYHTTAGELILRPVQVNGDVLRSWTTVNRALIGFWGDTWLNKRNKAKALRDALRGGQAAVRAFSHLYLDKQSLPNINGMVDGWGEDTDNIWRCGYFDALELADFFIPLSEPTTQGVPS